MHRPPSNRARLRRRGFPLALAALWACLGFQPCAIAAAAGDSGCPHGAVAAAHAMHATPVPGHGQAPVAPDCHAAGSSCCDADAYAAATRSGTPKADDGGEQVALPAPEPIATPRRQAEPPARHARPPLPPDGGRALHVLYCVYLD